MNAGEMGAIIRQPPYLFGKGCYTAATSAACLGAGPVTKLPLRIFGFCLLFVTLSLVSCQSVWHGVAMSAAPLIERSVG